MARDCVNCLWENGIKNDLLSLIYFLNTKAHIVMKTPFGQCVPYICSNVVRQGTVLGPVLNNCSIDKFSKESYPYFYGKTEIINKTNDLILNLTPENVTQHSRIVTTTHKGSSTPTKMSKIIGRQIHCNVKNRQNQYVE